MKIAVLDDYQDAFRKLACFARLKDHEVVVFHDTEKDPAKLAARLKDADAVILSQQRSSFPRAVIEKLPKLRLIAQTASLREHLDVAACTEKGIAVAAVRSGVSHSTAELTWGLILASLRHIPHEVQRLKQGVWQTTVGTGLHGKTLGIYGLGKIGDCVAQVGKAFGMNVICWGRETSQAKAREAGYQVPASREAFFENADVVSLHVRYKAETRGIVTAARRARQDDAYRFRRISRLCRQYGQRVQRHRSACQSRCKTKFHMRPHSGFSRTDILSGVFESFRGAAHDIAIASEKRKPLSSREQRWDEGAPAIFWITLRSKIR